MTQDLPFLICGYTSNTTIPCFSFYFLRHTRCLIDCPLIFISISFASMGFSSQSKLITVVFHICWWDQLPNLLILHKLICYMLDLQQHKFILPKAQFDNVMEYIRTCYRAPFPIQVVIPL